MEPQITTDKHGSYITKNIFISLSVFICVYLWFLVIRIFFAPLRLCGEN
jgi:hypothetical protein